MRGVLPDEYRTVYIPKRKGGERRIDIPNEALLAQQRSILYRFLSKLSPSPFAHGFVEKRSPVTAAIPHVGKKIVVKIDIENFFNSINFAQWREVMMHRLMSFPSWHRVLCTIHRDARTRYRRGDRCLDWFYDLVERYCFISSAEPKGASVPPPSFWTPTPPMHESLDLASNLYLPQGFATSPALSNLFMVDFDWIIASLAFNLYNANYTRYADDLIFSSPVLENKKWKPLPGILASVSKALSKFGLSVNMNKFVVMREAQQKQVLGLVVNEKLGLPRSYRKNLRAAMFQVSRGRPMDDELRGELAYTQGVEKQKTEGVMTYYHYEILKRAEGKEPDSMIEV